MFIFGRLKDQFDSKHGFMFLPLLKRTFDIFNIHLIASKNQQLFVGWKHIMVAWGG
jgi:hypothetical protein